MVIDLGQDLSPVEVQMTFAWLPILGSIQGMSTTSRRQSCELSRHSHVGSSLAVVVRHFDGSGLITDEGGLQRRFVPALVCLTVSVSKPLRFGGSIFHARTCRAFVSGRWTATWRRLSEYRASNAPDRLCIPAAGYRIPSHLMQVSCRVVCVRVSTWSCAQGKSTAVARRGKDGVSTEATFIPLSPRASVLDKVFWRAFLANRDKRHTCLE